MKVKWRKAFYKNKGCQPKNLNLKLNILLYQILVIAF